MLDALSSSLCFRHGCLLLVSRSLIGGLVPLFSHKMYQRLGVGWSFSLPSTFVRSWACACAVAVLQIGWQVAGE